MSKSKEKEIESLFKDIDRDFIGLSNLTDEVYTYNASDVLVQTSWELPIVVQWPESKVTFEFSSTPGDISFGILFVAAPEEDQRIEDLDVETVEQMGIVKSNIEPVCGTFEVPCEGVVFFIWDNNYDWSAIKKISYIIEVKQPCFTYPERIRVERSIPMLKEVVEELDVQYIRLADAQDCIEHSVADLTFLEDQVAKLKNKLELKCKERELMSNTIIESRHILEFGHKAKSGLCIRCLNKHLMSLVLGYLDINSNIGLVCKYWLNLMKINISKGVRVKSEIIYRDKVSRSEIRSLLNQLHFSKTTATTFINTNTDELSNIPLLKNDKSKKKSEVVSSNDKEKEKSEKIDGDIVLSDDSEEFDSDDDLDFNKIELSAGLKKEFVSVLRDNEITLKKPTPKPVVPTAPKQSLVSTHPPPPAYNDYSLFGGKPSHAVSVSYDNILSTNLNESFYTTKLAQTVSPDKVTTNKNGFSESISKAEDNNNNNGSYIKNAQENNIKKTATTDQITKQINNSINSKPEFIRDIDNHQNSNTINSKIEKEKQLKTISEVISNAQGKINNSRKALQDALNSPALEPPVIAESKSTRKHANRAENTTSRTRGKSRSKSNPHGRNNEIEADRGDNMLQHVKKIRSDQQMTQLIEFLQAGFVKIEHLDAEKRRVKKLIKAWNKSYEKKTGSIPTSNERRGQLRELYEEYQQLSLALRIRQDKMDATLTKVGLDREGFVKLRDKYLDH